MKNFGTHSGVGPGDKLLFRVPGTLSSSNLSVDLSKKLKLGSDFSYFAFKKGTTDATTGTFTAAAAVAGASAEVDVLILADANDIAFSGQ